jgi:hypothetical protein
LDGAWREVGNSKMASATAGFYDGASLRSAVKKEEMDVVHSSFFYALLPSLLYLLNLTSQNLPCLCCSGIQAYQNYLYLLSELPENCVLVLFRRKGLSKMPEHRRVTVILT